MRRLALALSLFVFGGCGADKEQSSSRRSTDAATTPTLPACPPAKTVEGTLTACDVDVIPSEDELRSKDNSVTVRDKDGDVVYYEGEFSSDDPAYEQPLDAPTP